MIQTRLLEIYPGAGFAIENITHYVNDFISSTGIQQGQLVVYYKHTTGSVIIGEHEAGIIADLEEFFEEITPINKQYKHHLRAVDYNGYAHIRAAIMPTSVIIPITNGELALGTHQEILILDNQPEDLPRFVLLQVTGD